ncbi:MAG TPA: PBP1A family penicillin-binding protein [Bacillota bacterium]|nr:PBP1A family penicillin-binding protein [Bacillota bacterium]
MKRKIIIGTVIFLLSVVVAYGATLPRDMQRKLEKMQMASAVYDRNNQLIGNLYYYRRIWVDFARIPKTLRNAVVAIEDSRFYEHNGVDLRGMARALYHNLLPGGAMEGGSTLTQQLAKIVLLTSERTLTRKMQDITLAMQIEQTYTKDEILTMYLNSVYLAHGNVGMEAAARYYFGKSASRLNLAESALLAGIIRSPENYSPVKHPDTAKSRRNLVLKKMLEQKYITKAQYNAAIASGLHLAKSSDLASAGGYFLDYIRELLLKEGFDETDLRFGGYKIYTSLDLKRQKAAERTMLQLPKQSGAKAQPEGALVSLDPKTGEIVAMVGGRSYSTSQYNRSIKSYRQPGSAIKPFVYATALEKGLTAASVIEDKPLTIALENGRSWSPENYDRLYRGNITLREALRNSVNTVAVQLLQQTGVNAAVEQMERMGINSLVKTGANNDLSLAPLSLGGLTKGVTPLELTAAYVPFANLGVYVKPLAVKKVTDHQGNLVKQFKTVKHSALSPQTAYITTMLLKDVVELGTGIRAQIPGYQVAGKTGTTSDYTNAWFVGYTPDLVTSVWIGNDRQDQPMRSAQGNIGSATATELWGSYMKQAVAGHRAAQFTEPEGIVWVNVNPNTGKAVPGFFSRDAYKEVFNEKNVPESGVYKVWKWFFPGSKSKKEPVEAVDAAPEQSATTNQ